MSTHTERLVSGVLVLGFFASVVIFIGLVANEIIKNPETAIKVALLGILALTAAYVVGYIEDESWP